MKLAVTFLFQPSLVINWLRPHAIAYANLRSTQHVTQYAIFVVEVKIYLNTRCVQTVWHSCKMLFMYTYFRHVTIANHFYTHIEIISRIIHWLFHETPSDCSGQQRQGPKVFHTNWGRITGERRGCGSRSNQKTSQPTSRPKCSYPDSGCKKRCASGHESLQDFLEWFIVRKVRFSCLYYPLLSIKCIHLYPLHIKYPEAEIGTSSKRICKIWKSPGFQFFFVTSGGCTVIVCWWLATWGWYFAFVLGFQHVSPIGANKYQPTV